MAVLAVLRLASAVVAAAASPAPTADPRHLSNPKFDPCGGYSEHLVKYLAGTPCVYLAGEGLVQVKTVNVNIPAYSQLIVNGRPYTNAGVSVGSTAFPQEQVMLGLGGRIMLSYYGPSFEQMGTQGSRATQLAAGTTNQQFSVKQMIYFNPNGGLTGSYQLVYQAPTGSPSLSGGGPSYKINPIVQFPVFYRFALCINLPAVSQPNPPGRRWAFAPNVGLTWRSPGNTMSNTSLGFNSASGQVSFTQILTQQMARHFLVNVGFSWNNTETNDYINDFVSLKNHTNTWTLEAGSSWQFGQREVLEP